MDISPAENQVDGYDEQAFPGEETDKDDDGDLCRICRSPETPDNPLRYPCACRGSIKFVHQECLRLWLNRRRNKQCEVCKRSYSFVPVYSENAPERLQCHEFLRGLLLRALRVVVWVLVILFNAYCYSLHPWGQGAAIENQRVFGVSERFAFLLAGLLYNGLIAYLMTMMVLIRLLIGNRIAILVVLEIFLRHGLVYGVVGRATLVLWTHMWILCDWWHDHLLRCCLFYILVMEHREGVRPRNAQLHQFGAIRRFLFLLDDNAFAVLAISIYVSSFFILLPYLMGRLVFALLLLFPRIDVATQLLSGDSLGQELVESSFVSSNSPILVGYLTILSLSITYLGSFVTLRQRLIQAIASLFQGFFHIAIAFPYLLWILSVEVWKSLSVVKDGFILCLKFGVFPLILGCWLDFCILPIFGTTLSKRLEILSDYPFVMIIHWSVGLFCLMMAFSSMELIQEILKKRPFWFLLDVTDPSYKITKLHFGQILFALAFHGSLIVIVVHLPIMAISLISPSFFPLQFWVYDERSFFGSMAAYLCLVRVGAPEWLAELIKPAIEPIVHKWIITVSSWLQLTEFLLENHANQNVRPLLQQGQEIRDSWLLVNSIAEGSLVRFYGSQNDTNSEEDVDDDDRFTLRIVLMLGLATMSLFIISTVSLALPISTGRAFFRCLPFSMPTFIHTHDDVYGFWIGCYILRTIYVSTCFIFNHIMLGRADLLLNFIQLWMRNALLFSIWISVIPALLGLLIDFMIITPSQVLLPVHSLLQDWLIGLVLLHLWTYLTMFTRINCFATVAWQEKLKRIKDVGINRLPFSWLLRDVIGSIIGTLLTTLVLPFLVAHSLFPLLGFSDATNLTVKRFIWPVLLAIFIIGFAAKLTIDLFIYIHRVEYDDLYLVGDRVADFTEDLVQKDQQKN